MTAPKAARMGEGEMARAPNQLYYPLYIRLVLQSPCTNRSFTIANVPQEIANAQFTNPYAQVLHLGRIFIGWFFLMIVCGDPLTERWEGEIFSFIYTQGMMDHQVLSSSSPPELYAVGTFRQSNFLDTWWTCDPLHSSAFAIEEEFIDLVFNSRIRTAGWR